MPLIEDDEQYSVKKLLLLGLPSFILAVFISFTTHEYAHIVVSKAVCGSAQENILHEVSFGTVQENHSMCAMSSFAGISWTFFLALASFGMFMRHPRNLFIASMAFINASSRIPETVTVFLQMLFHSRAKLVVDESSSIALLNLHDPTIAVLILFFFSLSIVCLTITVLHDVKMMKWKWPIALILFILMGPLEHLIWKVIGPFLLTLS